MLIHILKLVLLICNAFVLGIIASRQEYRSTHAGYIFTGQLLRTAYTADWLQCLLICSNYPACDFYNFNQREEVCDLSSNNNVRTGRLISELGTVFHQIKVRFFK